MDITAERLGLSRILGRAAGVASVKTATTALQCVLLEAKDGRLTARATDLYAGVEASTEAEVKEPGSIAVDARRAAEIAKNLPPGPVRVRIVKNQLEISLGKSRFKLGTFPASEYPDLPRVDEKTARLGRFEARDLSRIVAQGSYAMHSSEDDASLNATLFDSMDGVLRLFSSDRNRLAYAVLKAECSKARLLVPSKSVARLSALCGDHKDGQVEIAHHMGYIFFLAGDVILSTRLCDDKAAAFQTVFDRAAGGVAERVNVPREELKEAIKRVAIVSSSDKERPDVALHFSEGRVRITAASKSSDEGEDEVSCDGDCEVKIEVSPESMTDALDAVSEDEAEIGMNGPLGAMVIRGVNSTDHTAIVMPVRPR